VVTSPPYRLGLLFITRVAIPFAFVDQPQIIIRTFTIVGSLFVPFIAGTLYLNNFLIPADWGVPPNTVLTNVVLICALILLGSLVRPKLHSCHDSANFPRAGVPCAGSYPGWRTATEIECPSRVPGRPSREGRGGLS